MSNAELIYAAVVVFIGLPAMLKNWTAAALVLCYCFMQGSYYGIGIVYPPIVGVLADLTVIALIYAKQPAHDLWPYRGRKYWLAAWWLERSFWDRVILALFPVGWIFYAFARDPWWPLYWVSLAQLLAAGYEALEAFHTTRTAKRALTPDPSGFEFTTGWRDWNYG